MTAVPREFRRAINEHNRHCLLGAAGALFFAWLAWLFFYAVAGGAVLLFLTIQRGEAAVFPAWLNPAVGIIGLVLLLWGGVDAWRRRFRPPPDQPILGWHLLPDFLLLPARLTFSIGDHLSARIRLSRSERLAAWQLLTSIADAGRYPAHGMGLDVQEPSQQEKLVRALQLLRWIDLHASEEGWFYRILSDREEEFARLDQRQDERADE